MRRRRKQCYSGVGGQAVLEGIMMKNKNKYAVSVRKEDGEIAVETGTYDGVLGDSKVMKIPFIRGFFTFIDSLVLGMRALNKSAEYYDDEEETKDDSKNQLSAIFTTVFAIPACFIGRHPAYRAFYRLCGRYLFDEGYQESLYVSRCRA